MQRAPAALKAGLRSAFAFPILIGEDFYGVMEVFGREICQPDRALMEIVHTIGSQVGQFMARKAAEQNLRFVASHDPLTGLFNRSMFNERLQQALAQATRFERSLALLFIDLDGFKVVNDTVGHNAGDTLLSELATRLTETLQIPCDSQRMRWRCRGVDKQSSVSIGSNSASSRRSQYTCGIVDSQLSAGCS